MRPKYLPSYHIVQTRLIRSKSVLENEICDLNRISPAQIKLINLTFKNNFLELCYWVYKFIKLITVAPLHLLMLQHQVHFWLQHMIMCFTHESVRTSKAVWATRAICGFFSFGQTEDMNSPRIIQGCFVKPRGSPILRGSRQHKTRQEGLLCQWLPIVGCASVIAF